MELTQKAGKIVLAILFLVSFSTSSLAEPFDPGNILVSNSNILFEFMRDGTQVRSIPVPHPDTGRRDAVDVVVDRFGRAVVLNIAPFDSDYLSIYDPLSETWSHIRIEASLGNLSDGDLSIQGDSVFTKRFRINLVTGQVTEVIIAGRGVAEIAVGLDGLLYALDSGSPRHGLRILDPESLQVTRQLTLLDTQGTRLNARGIAVDPNGTLYVLDFDGTLFVYDADANLLRHAPSLINRTTDLDMSPGGALIGSNADGNVFVTDLTLRTPAVFSISRTTTYVGFVPVLGEDPDVDRDGILSLYDNCPEDANPEQEDADSDGLGDRCDPFPDDADNLGACIEIAQELDDRVAVLKAENAALLDELQACRQPSDEDGDGVPDDADACPQSDPSTVDTSGCTLGQFCEQRSGRGWASLIDCALADWPENTRGRDCRPRFTRGMVTCTERPNRQTLSRTRRVPGHSALQQ